MPPPIFNLMKGELIEYDIERGYLKAGFPVLEAYLNSFGIMQGGMIAAAIDNTLGPLSMLVAPPNFTRELEIKYKRTVTLETGYLIVTGEFHEQRKRQLFFTASVVNHSGIELATAKSVHWITEK